MAANGAADAQGRGQGAGTGGGGGDKTVGWVNGGLARIGTGSILKKRADSADIRFMLFHDAGYIGRESFELSSEQPVPIYEDSSGNRGLEPTAWPNHQTFALDSFDRGQLCSGLEFRFNVLFERR